MDEEYFIKVNSFLLFICLAGVVAIGFLIMHIYDLNEDINNEILQIENKIPKCPECPKCELKCPENKECPVCPECPKLPNLSSPGNPSIISNCPTVDQIVQGIFPGRNPKIKTDSDNYYRVNPYNSYDGLSTSNFYEQRYNFPMEKILKPDKPLRDYNITGENTIDNSIDNNKISYSQESKKMLKNEPEPSNTHSDINYQESNNEINKIK